MFEVRCVVGDKKLRDVLLLLQGNTLEPPVVIPTGNAEPAATPVVTKAPVPQRAAATKKKRKPPIHQGGSHLKGKGATQVVRELIERTNAIRISAREMKHTTVAQGYSDGAYSHAIKLLVADKTIRAIPGTFGEYEVLRPTQAHETIQHG